MSDSNTILITGATGNIGAAMVIRILKDNPFARVILLVRGNSEGHAQQRVEDALRIFSPEINIAWMGKRITVVQGDITLPRFGLLECTWYDLASEITHVIHAAATTQFQLPLKCAHLVNCIGTQNVMAFAKEAQESGNLRGIAHISTAYVCGTQEGDIYEDPLDFVPEFSNTYEQTKWEAEKYVRGLMPVLPVTVFRPSIVTGDSETGRTITFTALYPPLKLIHQGLVTSVPCSPDNSLDVVPIDFISGAIYHIFLKTRGSIGKTYHITAGSERSTTVGELVDRTLRYLPESTRARPSLPKFEFLPSSSSHGAPRLASRQLKRGLRFIRTYGPYVCAKRQFDNTHTREALRNSGLSIPRLSDYFDNILTYACAVDWGKGMRRVA